jgi:hypothetical protein
MTIFSEETTLLVKNWDNVKEILDAEKRLRKQLTGFLLSLEGDLTKTTWWKKQWIFGQVSDSEVFISKSNWQVGDDKYALCIGVEGFIPGNLFGSDPDANLYVWGQKEQTRLVEKLREKFKSDNTIDLGELNNKGKGTYIIKQSLPQCLPEEIDNFENFARKKILDHFGFYAQVTSKYSRLIARSIK